MTKSERNPEARQVAVVYDIANCGPRNRFSANGKLVHNSGGDKMNWQNMGRGSKLRDSVVAPPGDVIIVGDSSNIEARVLCWLACQKDAVEIFHKADAKLGPDVYCTMAERIYNRPINKHDNPSERQLGKTAVLGLGYGMGGTKFVSAVRTMAKQSIDEQTAKMVVDVYRNTHPMVVDLWKRAEQALGFILKGVEGVSVDARGIVKTCKDGLVLPNGLKIKYPELQYSSARGEGYSYFDGRARTKIYGGKVVENCLAEGTLIATNTGWKPIAAVDDSDLIYDGVDFVRHGGVVSKSVQLCRPIDGVWMTDDHEVLTDEGWKPALEKPEPRRADVWCAHGVTPSGVRWEEDAMGILMPVWEARDQDRGGRDQGGEEGQDAELRVPEQAAGLSKEPDPRDEQTPSICGVAEHARQVQAADPQSVPQLWGTRHRCLRGVGYVQPVLEGHGADVPPGADAGAEGQQPRVLEGELPLGNDARPVKEQAEQSGGGRSTPVGTDGNLSVDPVLPAQERLVFDILNCGPRSRFVVKGERGVFIVHNCIQALARIIVMEQTLAASQTDKIALSVHDEAVGVVAEDDAKDALEDMLNLMRKPPEWAPDLPLNSEGGFHRSYGKAKS